MDRSTLTLIVTYNRLSDLKICVEAEMCIRDSHEAAGGHSQNSQKDVQHHFLGTQEQ